MPLANLVQLSTSVEPNKLTQFNQLNASTFQAMPMPRRDHGRRGGIPERRQAKMLPAGFSYDWQSDARQFAQEGSALVMAFVFAIVVIYLVLAAQYESLRDPLIILISVPMSICGALVPLALGFGTINIYTQIGLVTLIGLISKHGILMVEFANEIQVHKGFDRRASIEEAARIRLRPILMTTAAMVMGLVPLLFASGAGANSRFSIGLVIVVGMLVGTLFTLFVLPTMYTLLARDHRAAGHPRSARPNSMRWPKEHDHEPTLFIRRALRIEHADAGRLRRRAGLQGAGRRTRCHHRARALAVRRRRGAARLVAPARRSAARRADRPRTGREPRHPHRPGPAARSRATQTEAELDRLPVVTAGASKTRSIAQGNSGTQPDVRSLSQSSRAGFDASWEIDLFGRLKRLDEAATARTEASAADLEQVRIVAVAELARNYYEMRGAEQRIAVTRSTLDSLRQSLRVTEAQVQTGRGLEGDLASAQANLATTESQLPALETTRRQSAYRVAVLAGLRPGELEPMLQPRQLRVLDKRLPIGDLAELLRRRPDVLRAERGLAASTADVGAVTAELYPRFDIGGFLGFVALRAPTWAVRRAAPSA